MKKLLLAFLFAVNLASAQTPDKEGSLVKWMSLKEAMEKMKTQPKPVIMDFYTDWCGWCKTMMKTTYANQQLAQYINTYFYPVKFNAEGKDTVEFLGEKYLPESPNPRTPHPLAVKLLNNKLMYPTTLFMNGYDSTKKEFRLNMVAAGYLEQQKLEPILVFILENAGRNASYDDFSKHFQESFYDSTYAIKHRQPVWLRPGAAFDQKIPAKKKSLVLINTSWCTSGRVMKTTTFSDTVFEKYLNEKFNLVDFDPEMTDTINFKGQSYTNPKDPRIPFHQLAVMLGRNSITFPSLIVVDENYETIDVIPSYITPEFLNDIIHYYGDNIYKTKSWEQYTKDKKHS
jgi:thioredoxin-related protein